MNLAYLSTPADKDEVAGGRGMQAFLLEEVRPRLIDVVTQLESALSH